VKSEAARRLLHVVRHTILVKTRPWTSPSSLRGARAHGAAHGLIAVRRQDNKRRPRLLPIPVFFLPAGALQPKRAGLFRCSSFAAWVLDCRAADLRHLVGQERRLRANAPGPLPLRRTSPGRAAAAHSTSSEGHSLVGLRAQRPVFIKQFSRTIPNPWRATASGRHLPAGPGTGCRGNNVSAHATAVRPLLLTRTACWTIRINVETRSTASSIKTPLRISKSKK